MSKIDLNKLRFVIYRLNDINQKQVRLLSKNTTVDEAMKTQLIKIDQKEELYDQQLKRILNHIQESVNRYEQVEVKLANIYFNGEIKPLSSKNHYYQMNYKYPKTFTSIPIMMKKGITLGFELDYALNHLESGIYGEYGKSEFALDLLDFNVLTNANIQLFQKEQFDPKLALTGKVAAKVMDTNVSYEIANQYLGVTLTNALYLLEANAIADANVSKSSVGVDLELGASIVTAQSSLSFELLGIDIELSVKGQLGSVGASYNYTLGADSIEFGGSVSALFGYGFNVKIDY